MFIKYLLSTASVCSVIFCEEISYSDLLKTCEPEQEVALREAYAFMNLNTTTSFHRIEGGLTRNRLYSFKLQDKKYVLRFMALGPSQPEEKRHNEMSALKIAHELGLAPACLFSDRHAVLLLMPFVEGELFHHPKDTHVMQLGELLHKLHTFSGSYPLRLSLQQRLEKEYKKGSEMGVSYPTGFEEEVLEVIASSSPRKVVPIHGDLHPANILVSNEGLSVIDWANATWDDPFVDLGYCCLIADLSKPQEKLLLEAYLGKAPLEEDWIALQKVKGKICLYTAVIWFRFSEKTEEPLEPYESRVAALDAELKSPTLKTAAEYLKDGVVVNFRTAPQSEVKSYALSFYKAYLESKRS